VVSSVHNWHGVMAFRTLSQMGTVNSKLLGEYVGSLSFYALSTRIKLSFHVVGLAPGSNLNDWSYSSSIAISAPLMRLRFPQQKMLHWLSTTRLQATQTVDTSIHTFRILTLLGPSLLRYHDQ
jgi:hypothetical protein